ncbi:MAG: hypothetical protein E6Q58_01720 [Niabella sp.]|nr:MAG: hypothetical protein E6Q58_01720 [Niabella sp.]
MICINNPDSDFYRANAIVCESDEAIALRQAKLNAEGQDVFRAKLIYRTLWDYLDGQKLDLMQSPDTLSEIEQMQLEYFKATRKSELLLNLSEDGQNRNDLFVKANPRENGQAGYAFQLYTKTFNKDEQKFERAEIPLSENEQKQLSELMSALGTQYGKLPYYYVAGDMINRNNQNNPGHEIQSIGFNLSTLAIDYESGSADSNADHFVPKSH